MPGEDDEEVADMACDEPSDAPPSPAVTEVVRSGPGSPSSIRDVPEADGECAHCGHAGQHGEHCRVCGGPVCRTGEQPNGACYGCGAAGWEGDRCVSCGAGFEGPNLVYADGEWVSPDERDRREADARSAQSTEDEEEHFPEMAYIDHTQNDDEPNHAPFVVGSPSDDPPHDDDDDAEQQSAGALTPPPQVADGLPAADASSSSSRGRSRSRTRRRQEGDGRRARRWEAGGRPRVGDGETSGSSDDGGARG